MWRPANFQVLSLLLLLLLQVDSGQESCEIANCVVHRVLRERERALLLLQLMAIGILKKSYSPFESGSDTHIG